MKPAGHKLDGREFAIGSQRLLMRISPTAVLVLIVAFAFHPSNSLGQATTTTIWGDVKVDESKVDSMKPLSFMIVIYNMGGVVVDRTTVPAGGRYRFSVRPGEYDIAVETETSEIARVHVILSGIPGGNYQQNLEFEWKPGLAASKPRPSTISVADTYQRPSDTQSLFKRAQDAVDAKKYTEASTLFLQVVERDAQDFQAWTELGTVYILQKKFDEAENAYSKATEVRPNFALAFLNLGRLRVSEKKYEEAIPSLSRVLELQPTSAEANYLMGESYLQTKRGSKAVVYLTEAARLGKADAHLRLATLYNAVGMKDKAAAEYEMFLTKKPDYPEKKKLEDYIQANKPKP